MPEISIQPAGPNDAEALIRVQKSAFQQQADLYGRDDIPPMCETPGQVQEQIESGEWVVLKAIDAGQIVGAVRGRDEGDHVYIGRLCVDPSVQKQGLGSRLMHAIEAAFPGRRYRLMTGHKSKGNLRFYKRLGYHEVERKDLQNGTILIYLEKSAS